MKVTGSAVTTSFSFPRLIARTLSAYLVSFPDMPFIIRTNFVNDQFNLPLNPVLDLFAKLSHIVCAKTLQYFLVRVQVLIDKFSFILLFI
jgi:hypothetical protein